MINELKGYSIISLLITYSFLLIALNYLLQSLLITDNIWHKSYAEQLSYERIEEMINGQDRWSWIGYFVLPIIYSIKFLLVACCLLIGAMFFDFKLKFSEAFKIALLADVAFILPLLIKFFWFLIVQKEYVLEDLQMFSSLSVISFFDVKTIGLLWFYPLQTLNVFELFYIFLLAFWVHKIGAKSYEKALNMVLGSYLPALFIWIVLVMFITLNLNPQA